MTQKEIFTHIAISIVNILPTDEKFSIAVLEMMRLEKVVEYTGYYLKDNKDKEWLDIFNMEINDDYIHELHHITQNEPPVHTNWNRAKFTLFPDGKMQMEYIWDQELQDEVDGYNNDINPTVV